MPRKQILVIWIAVMMVSAVCRHLAAQDSPLFLPQSPQQGWRSPVLTVDNGFRRNGNLRVNGIQLENQYGEPIQLRGMSSHGLIWYPQYTNARALLDTKQRGANLFRIAMYADSNKGGYNENPWTAAMNKALLYLAVENTLATGMYAIVDWHILEDKNPLPLVESAVAFFDEISAYYANEPGVIYEICNEPNGDTTWEDIRRYAEKVIPVIRKNSPFAVIIVGTPHYSSDILSPLAAPLPFANIMYSYHMYTGNSNYEFYKLFDTAWKGGLPIFVSEWGISAEENADSLDVEEALAFIEFMKQKKVSWANWSLCNKDEPYSAIASNVNKVSGWDEKDLTVSGKIIFKAFAP